MIEKDNYNRNTKADESRIKFYSKKPTLLRIFSSSEYRTLWSFLKPKSKLVIILTLLSFTLAFIEGGKALFVVGIIKGMVTPETEMYKMITFNFMDSTITPEIFGVSSNRIEIITFMFAGLVIFTIIAASGKLLNTWLTKRIQLELMRAVRMKVMDKIFSFDIEYFDQARSGELLFLMTAETNRFSGLVVTASEFIARFIQALFYLTILFYMSWDITLLTIVSGAIYFKLHIPLDMRVKKKSWESNLLQNKLSHFFHQIVYGIKMIKIGGCEKRETTKYFREHKEFERIDLKLTKLNGFSIMLREYVIVIILLLTIFYIFAFKDFKILLIKPENILAYLFLLSRTMPTVAGLQMARSAMINSYGPLSRVMELLHKDIKTDLLPADTTDCSLISDIHSLDIHDLSFSYSSNGNVLEHVSLCFQKNRTYALVGFSGSGKSTLMDIMSSVRQPVSGRLEINGQQIDPKTIRSFKQSVGYMNQEPIIFHDTIRNNLTYFKPDASDKEVWEALKLAAIDDFIRELPDGLATGMGERGLTVSGGQRQRIGLARVLLQNSPLLLLDEATNALDYRTEQQIYQNLKKLKYGRIIIVAAHRLSTLTDFDHIVVMNKGKVIEDGTHYDLMANASFYYNLFMVQKQSLDTTSK